MRIGAPVRFRAMRRKAARQTTLAIIAGAALTMAAFAGFLAWRLPRWYAELQTISDPKERISLENEIFKNVMQAVGGAFVLGGLYFTGRTLALNREGQITERFSKAVEHLGSEQLCIRLGGIHALARIAHDSPKDARPIMEIFCAFVRTTLAGRTSLAKLPLDASAALLLITTGEKDYPLDLSGIDLSGADFRNCALDHVNFEDSNLQGADLSLASLRSSRFRGADLMNSNLRDADLEGADLVAANLCQSSFRDANLRGTNLLGANLSEATLLGADLSGAKYATREQFETAIVDQATVMPDFPETPIGRPEKFA